MGVCMDLKIKIPAAFEVHYKMDKFADSFRRICYDLGVILKRWQSKHDHPDAASGRYEKELADMLEAAFEKSEVIQSPSEEYRHLRRKSARQTLEAEFRRAASEEDWWDNFIRYCPEYKHKYFGRLHELHYCQSYKGKTAEEWRQYWERRRDRIWEWRRQLNTAIKEGKV